MAKIDEFLLQEFFTPKKELLDSSLYITWAGHRKCASDHMIGPRVLDTYKLVFVISGHGYLEQGDKPRVDLGPEDAFALFPRIRHCYFSDPEDPWELMWVAFNGNLCEPFLKSIGLAPNSYILQHVLTTGIQRALTSTIETLGDDEDTYRLGALGHFCLLLTKLARESKNNRKIVSEQAKDDVVASVVAFIEQNYYNQIDVELLCNHVSYSRSFLSHAFRSETGMTIPEFINKVRVKKAKLLLDETDLPVKEIACSVGINDSFYFSKIFKNLTGVSPMTFRRREN